ncbi:MAG: 2-dehydro-3-deoxy-D-arabinonate dehydratase [Kiritimatiellia bacterium]|jgi:2-dehydro-3-deoxy-D-arabinonate dehydratase
MKLYYTKQGWVVEDEVGFFSLGATGLDEILTADDPLALIQATRSQAIDDPLALRAPIESQEVWAAGVTYFRSRAARMEESEASGGANFYDRVYDAERPELFFKANPHHVSGPGGLIRIRDDSPWNVPEPELTLCISRAGKIVGLTIGNDVSSRSIEGENPLYLPQAKTYDQACALGPCILMTSTPLPPETAIDLRIDRDGREVYAGHTDLSQMKRQPEELVSYLTRHNSFPNGGFLLTGTGIIPEGDFTLQAGDQIHITIEPIGTLSNTVA